MHRSRIAILGSGAQGSGIAADLISADLNVTLIEQWPAHVEAMRSRGLVVHEPTGVKHVAPRVHHLCEVAELRTRFDIVFLVVKAYDTRWSTELIAPLLSEEGVVVGVQNGMTYDAIADIVGADRAVGAVIEMASNMFDPGIVIRQNAADSAWFAIGGDVDPGQLESVRSALAHAGTVEVREDIRSAKWMKLVANAGELVPSAILDLPLAEAAALPGVHEFMVACGREAAQAAVADGARLVPIFGLPSEDQDPGRYARVLLGEVLQRFSRPDTLTTVLQDWAKGRRSEYRELNGHVAEVLLRAGHRAPFNARVAEIAARVESGDLQRGVHNIDHLLRGQRRRAVGAEP
ncbi:ketopantoate reductase family protein [Microbacterium sp. RD1]|uniref:ketopantoate reductase family protein n=1 Tax=Microbacterium sp. RD1 TaxID=3457313 RepID=UPI003FA59E94